MLSDEAAKRLHDRRTRHEALSDEEQLELERWYAAQDQAEDDELGTVASKACTDALTEEIEAVTSQLAAVTSDIKRIAGENAQLRRETAALRQQLTARALSPVT